jgi:hypothetical protein
VTSNGTVSLSDVWSMLDTCAPGHSRRAREHNWLVIFGGKTYPRLPVGDHGARRHVEIQVGHIRSMVRHFGIFECASKRRSR